MSFLSKLSWIMGKKKKKKVTKKVKKKVKKIIKKKIIKKKSPKKKVKKKIVKKLKKKTTKKKPLKKKVIKKSKIIKDTSLEEIGIVTHYFSHVQVAVLKITKGDLKIGDSVMIKGHTTGLKEKINSMQLDHTSIQIATRGQEIGLKVKSRVREHDVVYKVA